MFIEDVQIFGAMHKFLHTPDVSNINMLQIYGMVCSNF